MALFNMPESLAFDRENNLFVSGKSSLCVSVRRGKKDEKSRQGISKEKEE